MARDNLVPRLCAQPGEMMTGASGNAECHEIGVQDHWCGVRSKHSMQVCGYRYIWGAAHFASWIPRRCVIKNAEGIEQVNAAQTMLFGTPSCPVSACPVSLRHLQHESGNHQLSSTTSSRRASFKTHRRIWRMPRLSALSFIDKEFN